MRAYFPASADDLRRLSAGDALTLSGVAPASDDELDEFEALAEAAGQGVAVVAADVDALHDPLTLSRVASVHIDADGSGDLAWYAPQELDQVIVLLSD